MWALRSLFSSLYTIIINFVAYCMFELGLEPLFVVHELSLQLGCEEFRCLSCSESFVILENILDLLAKYNTHVFIVLSSPR